MVRYVLLNIVYLWVSASYVWMDHLVFRGVVSIVVRGAVRRGENETSYDIHMQLIATNLYIEHTHKTHMQLTSFPTPCWTFKY